MVLLATLSFRPFLLLHSSKTRTRKPSQMASNLLKLPPQISKTPSPFHLHHRHHHPHLSFFPPNVPRKPKFLALSLSSPPSTKEEAILQAKTCLSSSLEKPLNNPKLAFSKLKKLKQARFQLEIPLIDDSPSSVSQLSLDIFNDLPLKTKGPNVKYLIIWPNTSYKNAGIQAFQSCNSNQVQHMDLTSVSNSSFKQFESSSISSADVAVFLAPEASQLKSLRIVVESLYPKPVVILNPRWSSEEKDGFGEMKSFVGSFNVIYSFMGLEVKGILSRRKGVIFKCGEEKWEVFVEENGELKVVSRFRGRPKIEEVEIVLYNLMAMNSPITKSAKFLKELVNNATGKK